MKEVATIGLLILPGGEPGVRFNGGDGLMDVPPITRVALLIAAIQLCGAAITAICDDHPDDFLDIESMMDAITIMPSSQALN